MKRGAGSPAPLHHQLPVPGLGDGAGRTVVSNGNPHFCVGVHDFDGVDAASRNGGWLSVLVCEDLRAFVFTRCSTITTMDSFIDRMLTEFGVRDFLLCGPGRDEWAY